MNTRVPGFVLWVCQWCEAPVHEKFAFRMAKVLKGTLAFDCATL